MLLPRWRVKKQTGQKVFVVPNDDSAQGFIGKIFKLLFLLEFVVLLVNAIFPKYIAYLLPAIFLEIKWVQLAGLIMLHLSLFIVMLAQYQMNASWRVGFDKKQKTGLVKTGLFHYSRNPVFLGMLMTMGGLFLVLPNALTFAAMLLAYVVLQIQIRLEEQYLKEEKGGEYEAYFKKTRRWI